MCLIERFPANEREPFYSRRNGVTYERVDRNQASAAFRKQLRVDATYALDAAPLKPDGRPQTWTFGGSAVENPSYAEGGGSHRSSRRDDECPRTAGGSVVGELPTPNTS